jgi:sugar phosphate isomerase/epimerase
MNIHSGLVSISFRKRSVEQIIEAVAQAGLDGIEWGGDVHVPHGDLARAREVGALTRAAGLRVASYGSYYRAGVSEQQGLPFEKVLDSARALQAPTIRVWAGAQASATCSPDDRRRIVEDSLRLGELAAQQGIRVAFEYHRNTLTDARESARALLQATQAAGLTTYWQPTITWSHDEHLASLRDMLPWLANLHVFQWEAGGQRQPLADGAPCWRDFFKVLAELPPADPTPDRWALLEFVRDDCLDQFMRDAATLRQLLAAWRNG